MKTVFSSSELPHIWAAQKQQSGRAQANIFFEGPQIYSYGRHFCIANIIKPGVVLFTTRRYSVSTAKHINWVTSACNHMERVYCAYPEGSLIENLNAWQSEIKSLLENLNNPRKRPQTKEQIRGTLANVVSQVDKYLSTTGQKLSKKTHAEFILYYNAAKDQQAAAALQTKLLARAKAEKRKQDAQNAEVLAEAKKALSQWKAGHGPEWYKYRHLNLPVALRVNPQLKYRGDKHEIETSKGARVSYQAGKLLYNRIRAGYDVKGYDIDGYTVISLNGVLKIGCHEIERKEIDRLAKKEGW